MPASIQPARVVALITDFQLSKNMAQLTSSTNGAVTGHRLRSKLRKRLPRIKNGLHYRQRVVKSAVRDGIPPWFNNYGEHDYTTRWKGIAPIRKSCEVGHKDVIPPWVNMAKTSRLGAVERKRQSYALQPSSSKQALCANIEQRAMFV